MHTEMQLRLDSLVLEEDGQASAIRDLLPGWDAHDRFGIVVTEPVGALGASLLIQAAVALFYEVDTSRRELRTAQYPDIYLFHVGGPWGDHSAFDFWPPRKEVHCPAEPIALLEALNDRAITRLAVPSGGIGQREDLARGPSTWAEQGSFLGRIRSCLEYNARGRVESGNLLVSTLDARFHENTTATLDPGALARDLEARGGVVPPEYLVGPSRVIDIERYNEHVESRSSEVDPATLNAVRQLWRTGFVEGRGRVETYSRVSGEQTLALIAGVSASPSPEA